MWTFLVFDEAQLDWSDRVGYLIGPDDVPVQGEIRCEPGKLIGTKPGSEPAGLGVQVRVGPCPGAPEGLGRLTLRTCLLPASPQPYLLSVELARHRIMLVLNKLEEWGLFDLPPEDPILSQFDRAREAFTLALVSARTPGGVEAADRHALESLALAIDASERLALTNAERQGQGRVSGRTYAEAVRHLAQSSLGDRPQSADAPVKPPEAHGVVLPLPPQVGCVVSASVFAEPLARVVSSCCDFVSIPMKWNEMEPTEGKYAWQKTDRWIEWAVKTAKLPVVGGPVIDFRRACVPEWLYIWEHDYETLRELAYEHVRQIVTRYRRAIGRWTIASGLHVASNFSLTFDQLMDLTRICVMVVKKLQPAAKVNIELAQPWGEYCGGSVRAMPPQLYAELVAQSGIQVDGVGVRVQMGHHSSGRSTRDLMAFSELLDRLAGLDRPLSVVLGVPSEPGKPDPERPTGDPGVWRGAWTAENQARWLSAAMSIALAKPFVHSVAWQDLYDGPGGDMPTGGIVAGSGLPKPAAKRLLDARQQIKSGRAATATL